MLPYQAYADSVGLYKACKSPEKSWGQGYCTGYISATLFETKVPYCAPKETSMADMVESFKKYITKNPENSHRSPPGLMEFWLTESFPCKGDTQK